MSKRYPSLLAGALLFAAANAQVAVDRPVQLEGTNASDRQVSGLHDATAPDDALNARTMQAGVYRYAEVVDANAWQATFQPPITQLNAGLCLLVHCVTGNTGPIALAVDGHAPLAVLAHGDQPLDSGSVEPGATVAVVFDGNAFQLISARLLERKPCPSGTVAITDQYCIEPVEHDTAFFGDAAVACGSLDLQLCSWGEWYYACTHAANFNLQGMTGNWEWTNSAANADGQVRVVGVSTCTQAGASTGNQVTRTYRCCYRR